MRQTTGSISAASEPKFTILWRHVKDILLLNKVFPIVDKCLSCEDIAGQSCPMVPRWRFLATFCDLCFQRAACNNRFQTCILNSTTNIRSCHAGPLFEKCSVTCSIGLMGKTPLSGYKGISPIFRVFCYTICSSLKRSGMARVNELSHSFTCHPHVYPQVE